MATRFDALIGRVERLERLVSMRQQYGIAPGQGHGSFDGQAQMFAQNDSGEQGQPRRLRVIRRSDRNEGA